MTKKLIFGKAEKYCKERWAVYQEEILTAVRGLTKEQRRDIIGLGKNKKDGEKNKMLLDRKDLVGERIGLFDRATGASLLILRAVDITDECPPEEKGQKLMLVYTADSNGLIVQIRYCQLGQDSGAGIHFLLKDVSAGNSDLIHRAKVWGFDLDKLCKLAHSCAPTS